MTMTVNNVGDATLQPGSVGYLYTSDQLIAGDLKLVTEGQALIVGGLSLPRGTILGKVDIGALVGAGPVGTGNGTLTLITAGTNTKPGVYTIRFLTATTYTVTDPDGEALPNGANGAYANAGVNFTITAGGTPFVAGDSFTITVAAGSGGWKKSIKTAVDGSQRPVGVLAIAADASGGNVNGGVYLTGEFNENQVAYDVSWTLAELKVLLRDLNIFLKSAVTAAPPT